MMEINKKTYIYSQEAVILMFRVVGGRKKAGACFPLFIGIDLTIL